jgi:acyl carrier protein phosphodiesterase
VEAAARVQPTFAGPVYSRRQPEKTALYQVLQKHLLTFEQQWSDQASGRTLPKFVTEELQQAHPLLSPTPWRHHPRHRARRR